jgi:hypothetical protein
VPRPVTMNSQIHRSSIVAPSTTVTRPSTWSTPHG